MAEGAAKKLLNTPLKVLMGILAFVAILLIIWGASELVNNLPDAIKSVGSAATSTPINAPSFLNGIITVVLGEGATISWENLILYIAIFMILFFALADIVSLFSTFNETTSWVIGFGLAIIAGVTKMVNWIAGVFAVTAGIGAIGIGIIVCAAVFAAVVLNLGIGGPLKKWRRARQKEINKFKAESGFDQVASFIKGSKTGTQAAQEGQRGK